MFHCFGQNAIFNSALNACATIVLHRSFEPETIINSVTEFDITMFFGVPTTFILLLEKASKTDLTARYYFTAAAGLPEEIAKQLRGYKIGIYAVKSRGDREATFGGLGESWKGCFVGGKFLIQAVTNSMNGDRLYGNFPEYTLLPESR